MRVKTHRSNNTVSTALWYRLAGCASITTHRTALDRRHTLAHNEHIQLLVFRHVRRRTGLCVCKKERITLQKLVIGARAERLQFGNDGTAPFRAASDDSNGELSLRETLGDSLPNTTSAAYDDSTPTSEIRRRICGAQSLHCVFLRAAVDCERNCSSGDGNSRYNKYPLT